MIARLVNADLDLNLLRYFCAGRGIFVALT
jgi:hypothetical protein